MGEQSHDPAALAARIRRIEDWRAINELCNAYAFHFDRNEPVEVAGLFTDEATIDYGPEFEPIHGRDSIVGRISAGLDRVFEATSHHISNISVDFDGTDSATAIAYVYAWHRYRDGAPDGHLWAQYHTRVRRTPAGWRFSAMVLEAAGTVDFHRSRMHPIGRAPAS